MKGRRWMIYLLGPRVPARMADGRPSVHGSYLSGALWWTSRPPAPRRCFTIPQRREVDERGAVVERDRIYLCYRWSDRWHRHACYELVGFVVENEIVADDEVQAIAREIERGIVRAYERSSVVA